METVKIKHLEAIEVLDSRGFPTVEVEMQATSADRLAQVRAIVPSGASTGEGEALELRDGDEKRYWGKGVLRAVKNVNEKIAPAILKKEFAKQSLLDDLIREIDGTENKQKLGANAILAVSLAFSRASAELSDRPLFQFLAETFETKANTLPVPLMNILNGGAHADNGLNLQEFMIVPVGFDRFHDALRAGSEVFHALKKGLKTKGLSTSVGDEGGFAPTFSGERPHEQAIEVILEAIQTAGYKAGKEIFLALDCASSEFCQKDSRGEWIYQFENRSLTSSQMIQLYDEWLDSFPIISIEDGLSEHDWKGWTELTKKIGNHCQLVGDDLFVTNAKTLSKGIKNQAGNSILIKLNQIGTVTETLETMKLALQSKYSCVVSHRSGETEDTFIADLAVATNCGQIKTGSLCRTDRTAKYNQLLRIEKRLGKQARFAASGAFQGL